MSNLKLLAKNVIPERYVPQVMDIYGSLVSLMYAGEQFICPICGGHFQKLLAKGTNKKYKNAVCPRCFSHSRHRLLYLYLSNRTNFFTEKLKVLHFAPEICLQKKFKALPNLDYITADLNSPLAMVKLDITDIPFEADCFDVILCNHVLEHVMDDRKAMQELFRVLKPGGFAILQVPIDYQKTQTFEDPTIVSPQDRKKYFGLEDHVRVYGLDYKDRLENAGFTVQIEAYARNLEDDVVEQFRLWKAEDIYLCTKQN